MYVMFTYIWKRCIQDNACIKTVDTWINEMKEGAEIGKSLLQATIPDY